MSDILLEDKIAPADYDVLDLIKRRWSPRSFSGEPVSEELLRQFFEAARWAPSSYNEQPWRFIVATKDQADEYQRMAEVMTDFNRSWAESAPVLILTAVKDHFNRNNKPNRHAVHDLGQAVAYLTLEAIQHDIYVHQMAGIIPEKAVELFDIPGDFTPVSAIALGYLGEIEDLPEKLQERERAERSRLPLDEVTFRGTWNEPESL